MLRLALTDDWMCADCRVVGSFKVIWFVGEYYAYAECINALPRPIKTNFTYWVTVELFYFYWNLYCSYT